MQGNEETRAGERGLTAPYWRHLVHLMRPFPDFDLPFVQQLRQQAVKKLKLKAGDHVLDIGCGLGGSFPYLVEAVTQSGLVVGVEISPEAANNAQRRIQKHGWTNVHVITADATRVHLEGHFDAVLMLGTPDIYDSRKALANVMPCLRHGARFAAFGAKLSEHRGTRTINCLFQSAFAKSTFASTPRLEYRPWRSLQNYAKSFAVEERFFGWMFLAWGEVEADGQS
jgi:demethylmenaquinone methyltransferase/2-methoxy-6-polyprenyl-1,4-benzoquinol methylase